MTLKDLFIENVEIFKSYNIEDPSYEFSLIASRVFGLDRSRVLTHMDMQVDSKSLRDVRRLVKRRIKGIPMAYILGYRDFYKDRLQVGRGTLIPRPETEHLVETALKLKIQPERILEIGVGSGAILISLARIFPDTFLTGLDVHLRDAKVNLQEWIKKGRVKLIKKNVFRWKSTEKFDLVVSNPPYLSDKEMQALPPGIRDYEPRRALYGGSDGLKFYRFFALRGREWLNPGGKMILEVDTKWRKVQDLFEAQGMMVSEVVQDYQGLERVMVVELKG